jgi:predicted translin family RNA/ssDNA-binding protein
MAYPKTLGASADKLYRAREARLALDRQVKKLKAEEVSLTDHIGALLSNQRLDKASGKIATVSKTLKPLGSILDWPALLKYAADNEASDLIERRVSGKVLADRVSQKEKVPGVKLEYLAKISLTKR